MEESNVTIELNPKERSIYDKLRSQVVRSGRREHYGIGDLIFFLPDLTVLLWRLLKDPRVPMGAKAIALFGVGYVLSPIDLMPALLFGPFGLVDDLLVVSAALSRLLNYVHPDIVRSHWSGKGDVLDVLFRVTAWSEEFVGGQMRSIVDKVKSIAAK